MWINLPLKIVHNKHNNLLLFDRNYSEQLQNYCKEEEEVLFSLFVVMHQHHGKFLVFKKSYLEINMILKLKDTEYQQTDRRTDRCVVCSSEQRAAVVKQVELLTVLSYRF